MDVSVSDFRMVGPGEYRSGEWGMTDAEMVEADIIDGVTMILAERATSAGDHAGPWSDAEIEELLCWCEVVPDLYGKRAVLLTKLVEQYAAARLRYELEGQRQWRQEWRR